MKKKVQKTTKEVVHYIMAELRALRPRHDAFNLRARARGTLCRGMHALLVKLCTIFGGHSAAQQTAPCVAWGYF